MRNPYLHVAILFVLLCTTAAATDDCRDWSGTMGLPVVLGDIDVSMTAAVGPYLVGYNTDDATLSVYLRNGANDLEFLGAVTVEGVEELCAIDGEVFLVRQHLGALHLDLTDSAAPVVVELDLPDPVIDGIVPFAGGCFILPEEGPAHAVDDLLGSPPAVLFELDLGTVVEATATDSRIFAAVEGQWDDADAIYLIDVADPAAPVVGEPVRYTPDEWVSCAARCNGLLARHDRLYVSLVCSSLALHLEGMAAVDIGGSPPYTDVVGRHAYAAHSGMDLLDSGLLVYGDGGATLLDLDFSTAIGIPTNVAPDHHELDGSTLYMADEGQRLSILDLGTLDVVEPTLTLPNRYSPSVCGRDGMAVDVHHWQDWDGQSALAGASWTIYDQTDPEALAAWAEDQESFYFEPEDGAVCSMSLIASNDRWAAVELFLGSNHGSNNDYYVYDRTTGEGANIAGGPYGAAAVLDGDHLWVSDPGYGSGEIRVYSLQTGGMIELDSHAVGSPLSLYLYSDVYVARQHDIMVFRLGGAEGTEIDHLRTLDLGPDITLTSDGIVEDGLLYHATADGLAIIDLAADGPDDPPVLGVCSLDVSPEVSFVRQGTRIIARDSQGWQMVDVSDPAAPHAISPYHGINRIRGLVWDGDLLYITTQSSVRLYDISNPSEPAWIGQSAFLSGNETCGLDGYVVTGRWGLLPHCTTGTAVGPEAGPSGETPGRLPPMSISPNPFNPATTITFELDREQDVILEVFDLAGRRRARLLQGLQPAGTHHVRWDGRDTAARELPAGTYVARLVTAASSRTAKLCLLK